jgi:hypothetical protein
MAIKNPQAPEEGREIIANSVGEILRTQPPGGAGVLQDLRTDDLAVAEPHQAFVVGLGDLAAGKLLKAARPAGWRYLLIQGTSAVAEIELDSGEGSRGSLDFRGLHQTPFSNATLKALRMAEELPQVKKQDYELRFLTIPSVYLAAVWLHGDSGDIIIPIHQPPAGLQTNRPYSEKAVITALQPRAKQLSKFDAGFERNQGKPPKG